MDPYVLGEVLGFLLIFVWLPYQCYHTGYFIASSLGNAFDRKPKSPRSQKDPIPRPQKDPIPRPARRKQETYSVEEALTVLQCDRETFKRYILEGKIRTFGENGKVHAHKSDVLKLKKKAPKRSYPVISSFDEAHRITNPVEFGA
jgi:hypothetical protein